MTKIFFNEQANLLKVLAHPTRLAIISALTPEPKCVTDVCQLCDASQPNISQHLAILRREGVVKFYEKGKSRCYFIAHPKQIALIFAAICCKEPEQTPSCC